MPSDRPGAIARFSAAPLAHLATTRPDGKPHIVPVTFAVVGEAIFTMVDHKPKSTTALQRLDNIAASGRASILVDHYESDWSRLWWVRIDGRASVLDDDLTAPRAALQGKYSQYSGRPPQGPAIRIEIEDVSWWGSAR